MILTTATALMIPVLYVATAQAADRAWQMIREQDVFDTIEVRIGGRRGFTATRSAGGAWSVQRTALAARRFPQAAPADPPQAR